VAQAADDQPDHPAGDERICHVEGGPVVAAEVDVEKVDHLTNADPIHQIANGAPHDAGHRDPVAETGQVVVRPPNEANHDGHGQSDQKKDTHRLGQVIEHAEGDPTVVGVDDVEESGDDRDRLPAGDRGDDPPLGQLIEGGHRSGHPQQNRGATPDHCAPTITSRQRPQTWPSSTS